eukprot:4670240-Lingulodinium_polyedra.AAC.1
MSFGCCVFFGANCNESIDHICSARDTRVPRCTARVRRRTIYNKPPSTRLPTCCALQHAIG